MLKRLIFLLMISCNLSFSEPIKYTARITYYWPGNGGQKGNQTSTGEPAVCGKTVAVDPKVIPYGSEVSIPQMGKTMVAVDTGKSVKNRTASKSLGRNNIVIDVFCDTKEEAMRRIKMYPMFMEVFVIKR
jgi:3D (Asp-Asp-Asp) domain-containing protein